MNRWSWPSWQCAAGSPWGHMGQVCKLDAVLLLRLQGSYFCHPASEREKLWVHPATFEPSWALHQQARAMVELSVKHLLGCHSFYFPYLPCLSSSSNQQLSIPPCLHTQWVCSPCSDSLSAFFINDSSASLHLNHMHTTEGCQSLSITLINW